MAGYAPSSLCGRSAAKDATSPDERGDQSMDRAGRGLIGELPNGIRDPAPGHHAVIIPGGRELVGASGAFLERLVAVPLQHELRRSPNIDLGYHAAKVARRISVEPRGKKMKSIVAHL